ncbi:MAG TPA: putative baseplate assembly protein, partial [Nodosilinea sp.]|nr:putative baseplate assembly protein [Nodosilinea sp.]
QDRFTTLWSQQPGGDWAGPELPIFNPSPRPGNCVYLVFEPGQPLDGAVLALTVRGEEATPTGINPSAPPRRWEAWDGKTWCPVLLRETDDQTQGFSFSELARQGGNPVQGADILLHLPQVWPVQQFVTYQGRWLRCVHTEPEPLRPPYSRSPQIVGLAVRALGGTVTASQSEAVLDEVIGVSDGNPGQSFQLQRVPVLERRPEERLEVLNPDGTREFWTEVRDFAASTAADRHYTLDGVTGTLQFGPLVREPMHLKTQTLNRLRNQTQGHNDQSRNDRGVAPLPPGLLEPEELRSERQYGAVPPRGATLRMVAYRTGGGQRGNVQAGTVTILKTAVPYVTQVINHGPGRHGADAEALEQAVLRVPQILRTRDRAVTAEDFESLTLQAVPGAVARARCLEATADCPGLVRLLVVPHSPSDALTDQGLHPEDLQLGAPLQEQILGFLRDRKLLGIQVGLQAPSYIGVTVQTEVTLEPEYQQPHLRDATLAHLRATLCRFLHPVVGGPDQTGWPFGRPVYTSDIVRVLQKLPQVRYLGAVQLYEIRPLGNGRWERYPEPQAVIEPGPQGLICSWASGHRASHTFTLMPG